MKTRSILVTALIAAMVLIAFVSTNPTQAQQDIKLKDYKPVAGKLISAPDNWKLWAKTEGADAFFSRLKDTGFTPTDNQNTVIMELVKVASFAVFGKADESPLYVAVAETNIKTLTGNANTNPDELLKQINVINVNGRKAGYMVQKLDDKETFLRLLYPETERVIAIEIDASNASWKQGDLLKRIATSFRNEGETIDAEAYKQIDLGLGEKPAADQPNVTPGTASSEQVQTVTANSQKPFDKE